MKVDQKNRLKKLIITVTLVLSVGIIYYIFVRTSGYAVPCVINKITGIYCAGCGITRMFVALFQLDFTVAARNNLLALMLIIPVLIFAVNRGIKYVKYGALKFSRAEKICVIALIILLVIFTVIRNIPTFNFLQPI